MAALKEATDLISKRQRELAGLAELTISTETPQIVAAALLQVAFNKELNLPSPQSINERHRYLINLLLRPSDFQFSPAKDIEANSWIAYLRLVRRREKLLELKIAQGDILKTKAGEVVEVSSISGDGRVNLKGGRGFGAWPDQLSVIARVDDRSEAALDARRQAANTAARRAIRSDWSLAKSRDLSEFITEGVVTEEEITNLESVLAMAKDEKPIQKFLEDHNHITTALLVGMERFCLPQKRLGVEYVPDFIIGDIDSLGVRWVLVELETPKSGIYLKNGSSFDAKTRKGVNQVIAWRNWLADNIAYARGRRTDNGLGLFDIREKTQAIVLVGRRQLIPDTKDALRHEHRQSNNIEIHTYDWLLEVLYSTISRGGQQVMNPYLLGRNRG